MAVATRQGVTGWSPGAGAQGTQQLLAVPGCSWEQSEVLGRSHTLVSPLELAQLGWLLPDLCVSLWVSGTGYWETCNPSDIDSSIL